jgi:cytochrome c556
MSSNFFMTLGIVLGIAVIGAGTAFSAEDLAFVKHRQALMKGMGKDLKAVKDYTDGKGPLAPAQAGAADIVATTGKIPSLFPPKTGMAEFPGKSGAKPIIWTQWSKFLDSQKTASALALKLQAATKTGDKKQISAAFIDLGKNGCGACHTDFRHKTS